MLRVPNRSCAMPRRTLLLRQGQTRRRKCRRARSHRQPCQCVGPASQLGATTAAQLRGGPVVGHYPRSLIGHHKEFDILLKAFGHRKLVRKLVVASHRLLVGPSTSYRCAKPWLGDVLTNSKGFPLGIPRTQALSTKSALLLSGDLVVGHRNTLSSTVILTVQAHHSVCGGTGACEEIQDYGMWFIRNRKAERVLHRIE